MIHSPLYHRIRPLLNKSNRRGTVKSHQQTAASFQSSILESSLQSNLTGMVVPKGPTLQDHFQRRGIQKQLDAIESIREDLTQEVSQGGDETMG